MHRRRERKNKRCSYFRGKGHVFLHQPSADQKALLGARSIYIRSVYRKWRSLEPVPFAVQDVLFYGPRSGN